VDFFSRRFLRGVAMATVLVLAYAGGVLTGVWGTHADEANERATVGARSVGVIDQAAEAIASNAATEVEREELQRVAIEAMLATVGDEWSSYYAPEEFASFEDALEGRYSGVGVWLRRGSTGVEVGSVQEGSPAASAGVTAGDVLVAVDGRPVDDGSVEQAAAQLRGGGGSEVNLALRRGRAQRAVRLTRADYRSEGVIVQQLRGQVLRLQIPAFTRGVGREVREALAADAAAYRGGIILDLRDNSGGYLDEAVEVASAFLDGGTVVSYQRRGEKPHVLKALGSGDTSTPVVVLVNEATASAAEVVAGALQDRARGVVVGSRTYGKGSVQEPSRLSDGSALELTVGQYLTPSGRSIEGEGVEPDVAVEKDLPRQAAERRAMTVLSGLLAALNTGGRG
jgi:carboxyl-terminal processing protease